MELLVVTIAGLILAGVCCGFAAFHQTQHLRRDLLKTQKAVSEIESQLRRLSRSSGDPEAVSSLLVPESPSEQQGTIAVAPASPTPPALPASPPTGEVAEHRPPETRGQSTLSLEMRLGTRWIIWLGMVIFLGGVALALKYTYDHNLIGPAGRVLIGTFSGIVALLVGEYFQRRRLAIPFQAFTGVGLAILYLCVFFAFQVYDLIGPGTAMGFGVCISLLAVSLSVVHNALPIALLAVTGGYLSPMFFSTGENAPYMFFTYIALLNLVALGAAFFRRWRVLDLYCLVCTVLLYVSWHQAFYAYPEQTAAALTFITLFYVMFMAAPMVYSLVRGIPGGVHSQTLLISNSVAWLACYHVVLFRDHRQILGFVVLGQAALVFFLYLLWVLRVKKETRTSESLLAICLALLALAAPIQLAFRFVPIAWAVQGLVLAWLGIRFRNRLCRLGGVLVLGLGVMALIMRLPLHNQPFTPVWNIPFGTWLFVIVCLAGAAFVLRRPDAHFPALRVLTGIGALGLTCWLLTMETFLYWRLNGNELWHVHAPSSMVLLWTLIPVLVMATARYDSGVTMAIVARAVWAVSFAAFLYGLTGFANPDARLFINLYFLPGLFYIAALWFGSTLHSRRLAAAGAEYAAPWLSRITVTDRTFEVMAHAFFALLCCAELIRWGRETSIISQDMAVGVVSAVWALHACLLIWHGLLSSKAFRRYAGFALFALATSKTVLVDTFNLDGVYRIVSWLGIGLLLVMAALLYQRYSTLVLAEDGGTKHHDDNGIR